MKAEGRGSQPPKGRGDECQGGDTDKALSYVTVCGPITLGHTYDLLWAPDCLLRPVEKPGLFRCAGSALRCLAQLAASGRFTQS